MIKYFANKFFLYFHFVSKIFLKIKAKKSHLKVFYCILFPIIAEIEKVLFEVFGELSPIQELHINVLKNNTVSHQRPLFSKINGDKYVWPNGSIKPK